MHQYIHATIIPLDMTLLFLSGEISPIMIKPDYIEWTFFCKHFNKIQIADSFRTIFFIPLFTFFLHGLWNRAVTKGSWWCYKMPGNLGKSSLAILFLLSSSVKCGTTLADQGHFVQERSNLWLFISSENQPWNHQEREPTTTKKRVDLSYFFSNKAENLNQNQNRSR